MPVSERIPGYCYPPLCSVLLDIIVATIERGTNEQPPFINAEEEQWCFIRFFLDSGGNLPKNLPLSLSQRRYILCPRCTHGRTAAEYYVATIGCSPLPRIFLRCLGRRICNCTDIFAPKAADITTDILVKDTSYNIALSTNPTNRSHIEFSSRWYALVCQDRAIL